LETIFARFFDFDRPAVHPPPLMAMDFAVKRPLVRRRMPLSGSCPSGRDCRSRSRSRLGRVHLSDPASRRRPCGSLAPPAFGLWASRSPSFASCTSIRLCRGLAPLGCRTCSAHATHVSPLPRLIILDFLR
jgi:hypothetical protein